MYAFVCIMLMCDVNSYKAVRIKALPTATHLMFIYKTKDSADLAQWLFQNAACRNRYIKIAQQSTITDISYI